MGVWQSGNEARSPPHAGHSSLCKLINAQGVSENEAVLLLFISADQLLHQSDSIINMQIQFAYIQLSVWQIFGIVDLTAKPLSQAALNPSTYTTLVKTIIYALPNWACRTRN